MLDFVKRLVKRLKKFIYRLLNIEKDDEDAPMALEEFKIGYDPN